MSLDLDTKARKLDFINQPDKDSSLKMEPCSEKPAKGHMGLVHMREPKEAWPWLPRTAAMKEQMGIALLDTMKAQLQG